MVAVSVCLIVISITAYFFLSKKASPVPYFPSQKEDIPLILKTLPPARTVADLGAGTGTVVFAGAKAYPTMTFIALEMNPILVAVLWLKKIFGNYKNVEIIYGDMFEKAIDADVYFLYISPWYLSKAVSIIKQGRRIITYFYAVPGIKPTRILQGKNTLYLYS